MKFLERTNDMKQKLYMLTNQIIVMADYTKFKKKDDGGIYSGIFSIIKSLFQGIYYIVIRVGVYAGVISLLLGIAYLAWNSRKPTDVAEGKEVLGRRIAIIAVLFGVVSLVGQIVKIAPTA